MGGDDLADDDYLIDQNLTSVEDVVDDTEQQPKTKGGEHSERSRKRPNSETTNSQEEDPNVQSKSKKKKKKKKAKTLTEGGEQNLLTEAGRGIAKQSAEIQSAFLWTCYTHTLGMAVSKNKDEDSDGFEFGEKFTPACFLIPASPIFRKLEDKDKDMKMSLFVKEAVPSMKRLKNWKTVKSPMVLIISLSARRSVAVLKALSSLKVRCGKLFAKHMPMQEQVKMLKTSPFGVAVGTPNRLLKLCEEDALSLEHTELILIDCHEDSKRYTVCTMNDTAPDLMKFIQRLVQPQIAKRDTIKFTMY